MSRTKALLTGILERPDNGDQITDADIVCIMFLTRKMLEEAGQKRAFPTLNLFCNWLVHPSLKESPEGFEILEKCAEILRSSITGSHIDICVEISKAVSIDKFRQELVKYYRSKGLDVRLFDIYENWNEVILVILKVIVQSPISFPKDVRLVTKKGRLADRVYSGIKNAANGDLLFVPLKFSLENILENGTSRVHWKLETEAPHFIQGPLLKNEDRSCFTTPTS